MRINYSDKEMSVFEKVSEAADELRMPCYLIGGFVRDKIMGRPTKDADVVCVGDGLELAKKASEKFHPVPRVSFFKNFGTAHFKLSDGFDLEFVGARRESYSAHSRNPEVAPGTIIDDQNRRDFTINALAVSLNQKNFGLLVDPFNGLEDIKHKIIRTPLDPTITFSDDPLRMMRAIRFATQLEFEIEPLTLEAIGKNAERIR